MFRLYPATRTDIDTLVDIRRKSWLAHWTPLIDFENIAANINADLFAEKLAKHWHKTVVARFDADSNNEIAGFATIIKNRIDGPWLAPTANGFGAATGLCALAEAMVAKQHITPPTNKTRVVVEFLSQDIQTESFFRRRGYRVEKRFAKQTGFGHLRFVRMTRQVKFDESETPDSKNLAQTARYKSGIVKNAPKARNKT